MGRLSQISAILAVVTTLSSSSVVKSPTDDTFELLILHNNDMHARFEQTSQLSGACTTADREAGKCYGGFPRVATVVKEARAAAASGQGPPVLYLNAGDTYTGTAWFTIYKWKVAAEFLNALQPDAVSLGNNEIEDGAKISPFLENLTAPILASNVIIHNIENKEKVQKSIVINVNGVLVGLVGYLTMDVETLPTSADIEYIDEVIALTEEVTKLKAQRVKIIIALGYSQSSKDIEIATQVDGIDLVIAGYKNSYYWNGTDAEIHSINENQVTVTQKSGKRVPIIQSHAFNKYLGKVVVTFDSDGEIIDCLNTPIILDTSIPQDPEISRIVNNLSRDISSNANIILGSTAVVLDGNSCSLEECNLGNLVADSIMYMYAVKYQGERWTDAPVAIIHGGAIAASISPPNRPSEVTMNHLLNALPLESNLVTVTMNGTVLLQMLEHSVSDYRRDGSGQFLQFSGIRVIYDLAKDPGSRIVSAMVRCWNCFVPEFFGIDDWRDYKVLMPIALSNGQFGYTMLIGLPREVLIYDEVNSTAEFIKLRSPVYPEVSGRIVLLNRNSASGLVFNLHTSIITIVLSIYRLLSLYE